MIVCRLNPEDILVILQEKNENEMKGADPMIAVMQNKPVAWNALLAVILISVALVTAQPWWLMWGGVATAATLLLAWKYSSADRVTTFAALGATALVAIQAVMSPLLGWGSGLLLIALLLVTSATAWLEEQTPPARAALNRGSGNRKFRNLSIVTMCLAYASAQMSFFVLSATDVSHPMSDLLDLFITGERLAVGMLGLAIFLLLRRALAHQHQPLVRRLSLFCTLAYLGYLMLVISPLWASQSASTEVLLTSSLLMWGLSVALVVAVLRLPNKVNLADLPKLKKPLPAWRVTLNDYLTLMKYRVASLLLLTTAGAMVIAAQGWPGWSLMGWVMLGGLLSVGGAGALNHYLDRDLDINMGRTSKRPIPAGRMAPWKALAFGFLLTVLQFAIFWFKVNPLAAWLSLGGLLYYVIIYTMWLKRNSPQNIVIGGAAGAFPPLVGWAAVTGDLSLGALYLFAVIFYWTPPHFWALALMRKKDYARAGVPMLPVVVGEKETRRQIVLYTLLMIAVTIIMVPLQLMGFFYLAIALLLNGKFLWDAIKLYREPSNQTALTLYKYTLLYLALLFVAMAVDRVLVA